jgi:hypothetical protein
MNSDFIFFIRKEWHAFFVAIFAILSIPNASKAQTIGLIQNSPEVLPGYILFAPLHSRTTYLIDRCGREVHSWKSKYKPAQSVYLLPDGNLLRSCNDSNVAFINAGGVIEKLNWKSEIIWSYSLSTPTSCMHHDIYPMPNGNVLAILWEKKTPEQAKSVGRNPELIGKSVITESIIELKPKGKKGADIVWEWNVWDHLIQDINPALPNYGDVSKNPQLININYKAGMEEDWLHFNAVTYNPKLDQILVSNRNFSELYIIDHSTTKTQAAAHTGGRYKKGGDLLYRWGNAASYNKGSESERQLFMQHSPHWYSTELAKQNQILLFNNGLDRPGEDIPFSSVEIMELPADKHGNYSLSADSKFKPETSLWKYRDTLPGVFFSKNVSNAQRLKNGNTLICEGAKGRFFEVDSTNKVIWQYINPVTIKGPAEQGVPFLENQVFRCYFYSEAYAGLKSKKLSAGKPIELNPLPLNCFNIKN